MNFPVDRIIPELQQALAENPAAILVAEPGAGKTTRVPLALQHAPWLQGRKILMLEPRRLAARTAAARMAVSLGEALGDSVGYTVRLERNVSARTAIEVVTEGILTRRLQSDPELADTGLVIFDEFHERSLDGDLGLALVLDLQQALREDLRILIMSATLDTEKLSQFLQGAPVLQAEGRMFPVATHYLDRPQRYTLVDDVVRAIARALRETTGSLLVFLPGEGEIRRVEEALLKTLATDKVVVRPLYGAMTFAAQDEAIKPASQGTRKIVLATTIAETSLTIEGITTVIDCGLKRKPGFDPASGMTALQTVRVSLASAEQRRGRAGRLSAGDCYRLWPEAEDRALSAFDPPEILTSDMAPLALELAAWGVNDALQLQWLDAPPAASFAQAQDLLRHLQALDANNRITDLGKAMVKLPLHPRLAHMVVKGHAFGAGATAASLAAYLSERDGQSREAGADLTIRRLSVRGAVRSRIEITATHIRQLANIPRDDTQDISDGVLVALAWPDRIAQRRGAEPRYRMAGGGGAVLPATDGLAKQPWLAIATTDGAAGDQKIFQAASLSLQEIENYFAPLITRQQVLQWDTQSQSVLAKTQKCLDALVLEERPLTQPDPDRMLEAMLTGVAQMGLASLPWTEAANRLRARVSFIRRQFPGRGWPDLSDAALTGTLADWLGPYLSGISRKSHLERLDMLAIIKAAVPYELQRKLDELAPRHITVPSGSEVQIDYESGDDPVLRVRLQEMFGLAQTPVLAEGRSTLKIELLSPAGRPLAVTKSLETFWTNAYPDVRSDMRGRYPKHSWPEDPLATAPVKPRRLR